MTRLHDLYAREGQSPWLDNLKRSYLTTGRLEELIGEGVRGLTSNPTIMAKAIEGGDEYDDQFRESMRRHGDVLDAYWDLVVKDVTDALGLFAPLHEEAGGSDGFVSIEVAPNLARDTAGTVEAARGLHERIARPNLLVKIPASEEGVPAIRQMISEGRSINVTLIFSLERYAEVVEAYLRGLERLVASGGNPKDVYSVASFFVSRVDTEADKRLDAIGTKDALALRGKLAVANAKLAYEHYEEIFSSPRWEFLKGKGANPQRCLWASTSTKNPEYRDVLYVEELIGPETVNTMPQETMEDFQDHGEVRGDTVAKGVKKAHALFDDIAKVGVDYDDVTKTLELEGVQKFADSFAELFEGITQKRDLVATS